jgi:hypothetical protein
MAFNTHLYDAYLSQWLKTASGGRVTHVIGHSSSSLNDWVKLTCTTCGIYKVFDVPYNGQSIDDVMVKFVKRHQSANPVDHAIKGEPPESQNWKFSYTTIKGAPYPPDPVSVADPVGIATYNPTEKFAYVGAQKIYWRFNSKGEVIEADVNPPTPDPSRVARVKQGRRFR